ncbi:MAG: UDP-N-acetylmuramoyl-tripeptide--D-alanyl-D-alanine ligase [Bacteroidales bacterium]|jgi:UDP-N-acetylmuramoyl-tripeptide--D-alanyl-D-alanine ligase|nr:UDP-N-acetylmuramoyl-tripeptide--D-alanyl-D-alanine ligase [Bacteroidales bacterium]MCI1786329.1 UDP-N-acetylmuramoyl-tripeptide--D-alanyl-D-alanine ligase [Bacteroidales bacterium]
MNIAKLHELFLSCGSVITDSRKVKGGEMFFAIKGENFDGNEYALKALENGASYAVVSAGSVAVSRVASSLPEETAKKIITVADTLGTLQELAAFHRENIFADRKRVKVIGLTGTNGKTTTKELIRTVLSIEYNVVATEGNFNNDIGVPLSLLRITPETEIAVIEMGASHPDDIKFLTGIVHPDLGLITNVGKAHLMGFGDLEGVKRAKGQLYDYIYSSGGSVFVNSDNNILMGMVAGRPGLNTIPYGLAYSGVSVLPSSAEHPFLSMEIPQDNGNIRLDTHLVGTYNADNVLAALKVGSYFGIGTGEAAKAISEYIPSNNRSQLIKTGSNSLIVDAYNANPTSMSAALDNFVNVQASCKIAMLGDMLELGSDSVPEHMKILKKVLGIGLSSVFLVGEEFHKAMDYLDPKDKTAGPVWFGSSSELSKYLKSNRLEGCTILIKGSRGIAMEKIIPEL